MINQLEKAKALIDSGKENLEIGNAFGSSRSLAAAKIFNETNKTIIVLCENNAQADSVYNELGFFSLVEKEDLFLIPDTETLPYDQESPHAGLISERARAFHDLATKKRKRLVVTSISNAIRLTSSISHWEKEFLSVSTGQKFDFQKVKDRLLSLGYKEKGLEIEAYGEFIFKNTILDIFPVGESHPVRINYQDGSVHSIKKLSLSTQLSSEPVDSIIALSAKEIPVDEKAIEEFQVMYRRHFKRVLGDPVYEGVLSGDLPSGVEYYLPLFQKETSSIFDYLPKGEDTIILQIGDIESALEKNISQINHRFNELQSDKKRKLLNPDLLWLSKDRFIEERAKHQLVNLHQNDGKDISLSSIPNEVTRLEGLTETVDMLDNWLDRTDKIVFCLHSEARVQQLSTICSLLDVEVEIYETWSDAVDSDGEMSLVIAPIDEGFFLSDEKIVLITEKEMFGQAIFAKSEDEYEDGANYQAIQDLKNLMVGDPVVHVKHGVGRVAGLIAMPVQGVEREYLKIKYAEESSIFVPMDELDMVSRYGGMSTENVPMDKAGSEKWQRGLKKAMKSIEETAHALLVIQEERQQEFGIQFEKPKFEFQKFCREFPFQETRDQKSAVSDIIEDMTSPHPMNRTVVGDVGFGKTEVAMRAAFVAASQGYQVAIMVPTTLLAMQHYENFKKRYASFDIEIDCLSRYEKKEERAAVKRLHTGETKIVIGTHRLIQKDIAFDKLGLLVIDEEHRFGVRHKEKLKAMREKLDVLSMTATPIPRTLSMSLHGVRDISIISTPPAKRLSIRTIVDKKSDALVREAIQREMMRDGQAFILHNSVSSIQDRAQEIRDLIPGIRVGVGHGKMSESQLEEIMSKFYRREYDVLVCTTIIETGIDVPNANTILIENADRFGVAQLHQLRGRVGRSSHQAYAYLLPSDDGISDSANKRLKAMEKATKLGEGFVLATHDLEIRGAGELLGDEQSGYIQNIGFTLYMRLLNRAIELIIAGKPIENLYDSSTDVKIELGMSALIDSSFIENQQARLSFYKRFSSVAKISELEEIEKEIKDRYGALPETTSNIINVSKLRCFLKQIGIRKLSMNSNEGLLILDDHHSVNIDKVYERALDKESGFKMEGQDRVRFYKKTEGREERFRFLIDLLTDLAA